MSRVIGRGRYATETYPTPSTGGGGNLIVWRPDGLGDEKTWAGVMSRVAANIGPSTIYMPQPSPTVPGPTSIVYLIGTGNPSPADVYNMKGSRLVSPLGPHDNLICQIRQSATLHNLAGISGGLRLQSSKNPGSPPTLTFASETPGASMSFIVEDGAELRNEGGADVMLLIPPTSVMTEFYLIFNQLGTAYAPAGGFPAVGAGPNSILNVVALSGGLSLDTIQPQNWIGSDPSAVVNWIHDGTMAMPPGFWTTYHTNNAGTQVNQPTGLVGGSGPGTGAPPTFRPVFQGGGPPSIGCMFLDTSLGVNAGIPIWYTGVGATGWVDATGASA
jgi:hypothetical protein